MEKGIVVTNIVFDEGFENNNNNKSGVITIKSSETIGIYRIKGIVFFEVRGRMSSQKEKITSFKLSCPKKINENELYEIPFSFDLKENFMNSYKGKNVEFAYNLEIQIKVDEDDLDKLERSFFSKIKSLTGADTALKFSNYFKVENFNKTYKIKEKNSFFKIQSNLIMAIISMLLLGGAYVFFIPKFHFSYLFIGVLAITLLVALTRKLIANTLGIVSMETTGEDFFFLCKIKKTKKFNLKKQEVYYEVIEKVIDNRGTSSSTHNEVIYKSELKKLNNFKSTADLKFNYPERPGLHSLEYKDVSILWKMTLKGVYFGMNLEYKCEFIVE